MNAKVLVFALAVAWSMQVMAQPDTQRAKDCQKVYDAYEKLGFAYNFEKVGGQVVLYAGAPFFSAPMDVKKQFAETVSCVLMRGDPKMLAEFTITHWQTGKVFAKFHYGRLRIE